MTTLSYVRLPVCLMASAFIFVTAPAARAQDSVLDRKCQAPVSPLYAADHVERPLDLQLIVDYAALNKKNSQEKHRAVIVVPTADGSTDYIPVLASQRGKSRKLNCPAPALRISFLDQAIERSIEQELHSSSPAGASYLKRYYDLLRSTTFDENAKNSSQKNNVFAGLGDDVKLVTHCGASEWKYVGVATEAKQNDKLLSEFYIYKALGTLNTPVEDVRLSSITYINPDETPVYGDMGKPLAKLAFFREPKNSLAKRCGLTTKPVPGKKPGILDADDEASIFLAEFLHKLAYNADYALFDHNLHAFFDDKGRRVYSPYDFDLSGLVTEDYPKNPKSLEKNLQDLVLFLKESDRTAVVSALRRTLAAGPRMSTLIEGSRLSDQKKAELRRWLALSIEVLADHLTSLESKKP